MNGDPNKNKEFLNRQHYFSLVELAALAITRQQWCLALFLLFNKTIALIWYERNNIMSQGNKSISPNSLIWHRVADQFEALRVTITNHKIRDTLLVMKYFDSRLIWKPFDHWGFPLDYDYGLAWSVFCHGLGLIDGSILFYFNGPLRGRVPSKGNRSHMFPLALAFAIPIH